MSKKLSLILRGHIRNSFNDKQLYNYIKDLTREYDLEIYIQTWNILQTNISWRYLETDETPVNEEFIYNYFKDLSKNIKKIIILDDAEIELTGKITGRMGKTSGSYLGWKQMWYGIYEIADYVKNKKEEEKEEKEEKKEKKEKKEKEKEEEENHFIINTRFDVFNNSVSFSLQTINSKLKEVMSSTLNPKSIVKNIFLKDVEFFGIDNFYIGNKDTIFKLAQRFKFHLDEIVDVYPKIMSHEFYTFHVNNTLFLETWLPKTNFTKLMTFEGKTKKAVSFSESDYPVNDKIISVGIENNKNKPLFCSNGTRSTDSMDLNIFKNQSSSSIYDLNLSDDPDTISNLNNKKSVVLTETFKRGGKLLFQDEPIPDIIAISNLDKTLLLPPNSKNENNKMELFETNTTLDIINTIVDSTATNKLLTLSSSTQSRNGKLSILEYNSKKDPPTITKEIQQVSLLTPSGQARNNKLALLDSNLKSEIVINDIPETPQFSTLPTSRKDRNGNMALLESNDKMTTIINEGPKLAVLSTSTQSKSSKLSLLESNAPPLSISSVNIISNQPALVSSNIYRKGSISLVDSTILPSISINSNDIEIPIITSSVNRQSKPLINTANTENKALNLNNDSSIKMTNRNTRSNKPSISMNKSESSVVSNPVLEIDKIEPLFSNPVIITNEYAVKKPTTPAPKKSPIVKKPVPISKFSVTLDPNYLNFNEIVPSPFTANLVNASAKLINSNKLKTSTQSLSAYYELLAQ